MVTFYRRKGNELIPYDGTNPYIHWMGTFSTGMYRYGTIIFETDSERTYQDEYDLEDYELKNKYRNTHVTTVEITAWNPKDWKFAIYKEPADTDVDEWTNIDLCTTNSIKAESQLINGHHLYHVNIICHSDLEGEFIGWFGIGLNSKKDPDDDTLEYFRVGAEFWPEDEILKINLANQGTEIPDAVTKAIYDGDIFEDGTDWVLLNSKFKELLINHLDIMDNKGSYKSLENALKWFEYKELAELRECWRYYTPAGPKYFDDYINKTIDEETALRQFNSAKTTYIALRSLKRLPQYKECTTGAFDGYIDTVYDYDPDENKSIDKNALTCKWTEDELRLKMTLLGNFYERYFMPIHLNLIRSVVEDVHVDFFEASYGSASSKTDELYDFVDDINMSFDISQISGVAKTIIDNIMKPAEPEPDSPADPDKGPEEGGEDDKKDETPTDPTKQPLSLISDYLTLYEIHVNAGLPRENEWDMIFEPKPEDEKRIFACHYPSEPCKPAENLLEMFAGRSYNGIGCVVPFHFEVPVAIVAGEVDVNAFVADECVQYTFNCSEGRTAFDCKFLLREARDYNFTFKFRDVNGTIHQSSRTITPKDTVLFNLDIKKLVAEEFDEYPDPFDANNLGAFRNMYSRTRTVKNDEYDLIHSSYTQFIKAGLSTTKRDGVRTTSIYTIRTTEEIDLDRILIRNGIVDAHGNSDKYHFYRSKRCCDDCDADFEWIRFTPKRPGEIFETLMIGDEQYNPSKHHGIEFIKTEAFIPEYHKLVDIEPGEEITDDYIIVCCPYITIADDETRKIPYSKYLADADSIMPMWEFYSYKLRQIVPITPYDTEDVLMASNYNSSLPRGSYRIVFRCRYDKVIKEHKVITNFSLI